MQILNKLSFIILIIMFARLHSAEVLDAVPTRHHHEYQQKNELNNSSSASKELPSIVELEQTRRLLEEGDDFVELGPQRDIVLLLGITGAGKSTLGLILSGDNRNLTAVETAPKSDIFYIEDTQKQRISSKRLQSKTKYPEKMVDINGTVYYDCPGFSDTRTLAHDVATSHFIRRVIDFAARIKFLLVISQDSLESRSTFVDLIAHMASHVRNITAFRDGIALIVNKVKYAYRSVGNDDDDDEKATIKQPVSDEEEIKIIAEILMRFKEEMEDTKRNKPVIWNENRINYELAIEYIDIFSQKNGENYTKIGIMRTPRQAGKLSNNKNIQKKKTKLKNLIENNLKYIDKNADDLTDYTVSEKARYRILKSVENLHLYIFEVLEDMAERFSVFYAQQENELTDVFKFTEDIRQHVHSNIRNVTDFPRQLQATIDKLNVTFCEENLIKLANQTEYINVWYSVWPDLALKYKTQEIMSKSLLDSFRKRIIETMRWYNTLLQFNDKLASYDVQLQRTHFFQKYSNRNRNQYNELQAIDENSTQLDSDIVHQALLQLYVGITDNKKSILNDIWNNSMQPITKNWNSETKTLRIHGFHLRISEIRAIINSNEFIGVKNYELFAIDTIFIDDDIIMTDNLMIVAPVWIVLGSFCINLNGKDAENHLKERADSKSMHGLPGRAGQSAGNFFGIAFEIRNSQMLRISAIGGHGGDGQNGAHGMDGNKGKEFPKNKHHFGDYKGTLLGEFYYETKFNTVAATQKVYGTAGTPGLAGGNGGAGGYGGYCGDVQLLTEAESSKISISNCEKSADGKAGQGGRGGRGGQTGDTIVFERKHNIVCVMGAGCVDLEDGHYRTDRELRNIFASNGKDGEAGKNYDFIERPLQSSAIQKAITVNNYKFVLRASLIESGKHKDLNKIKKLLGRLDNNPELLKLYGANDFVDELTKLETQYLQLIETGCFEFYESLLHRVQSYSGDGSANTNPTLTYLVAAILTKIHSSFGGFDNYLVININEYLKFIAKNMNDSFKQIRLTLATATYQKSINDRINDAQAFITSLIAEVSRRLKEMKVNMNRSQLDLTELKKQTTLKAGQLKRKMVELEFKQLQMKIESAIISIELSLFTAIPYAGYILQTTGQEIYNLAKKKSVESEITKLQTEMDNNDQIFNSTIKDQQIFDSKLTALVAQLKFEIRENMRKKSQIGLESSRYKLTNLFNEFTHYLNQISLESAEEVRLSVNKLGYAIQKMLDINDRTHTYDQQSELAVYLNKIDSDSTITDNPHISQLEKVIKTNLICAKYKQAIKAVTLFGFPFADVYLADLLPRNLCDVNAFNASSVEISATAHHHIQELSNRIITFDTTVNALLDYHINRDTFDNKSGIGPFYRWSHSDHRASIHRLLAGDEVVFISEIAKTDKRRMAVKFQKIGIAIRTHMRSMQSDLDMILDECKITMKHSGFSHYRWHDSFYVIATDTNLVIKKSFSKCHNTTHSCSANIASDKLRDGNAVLSPYTMWTLKLNSHTNNQTEITNNLQRFADQVDLELEGTGTYIDVGITVEPNLLSKYYREYNFYNNIN